jgi:hypothetical protein
VLLLEYYRDGWPSGKPGSGEEKADNIVSLGVGCYKWYKSHFPAWDGGTVHKPMRVASGHLFGRQEWGNPMTASAGTQGPKKGWLWHPTSSRNDDVLICINASFMTQRVLKPWWPWTYPNSAVKRASARVIPGWVTSWEAWFGGAKSGQYCVIEGGSLHRCWGKISFPNQKPTNHF